MWRKTSEHRACHFPGRRGAGYPAQIPQPRQHQPETAGARRRDARLFRQWACPTASEPCRPAGEDRGAAATAQDQRGGQRCYLLPRVPTRQRRSGAVGMGVDRTIYVRSPAARRPEASYVLKRCSPNSPSDISVKTLRRGGSLG
jgi:hypothetical protein